MYYIQWYNYGKEMKESRNYLKNEFDTFLYDTHYVFIYLFIYVYINY